MGIKNVYNKVEMLDFMLIKIMHRDADKDVKKLNWFTLES